MTQSSVSEFDVTETANNILSSGPLRETAQEATAQKFLDDLIYIDSVDKLETVLAGFDLSDAIKRYSPRTDIEVRNLNDFDLPDLREASVVSSRLMDIAEKTEGDGVDAAIGAIAFFGPLVGEGSGVIGQLRDEGFMAAAKDNARKLVYELVSKTGIATLGLVGLRQRALRLFLTHYPPAHAVIRQKPIDQASPNLVSRDGSQAWPEEENRVSFWREDAQLNDHHGRWHDVYINSGIPTPIGDDTRLADRHGELFAYMHGQMLARYDAERLGVGLSRVKAFANYRQEIPEGYRPGTKVGVFNSTPGKGKGGRIEISQEFVPFGERPPNAKLRDLPADGPAPAAPIEKLENFRDELFNAAHSGQYLIGGKLIDVTTDNMGDSVLASIGSVDYPDKNNVWNPDNGRKYGNLHGLGHAQFGLFDPNKPTSVMLNLSATSRDPIFWRWHKHIDTIMQAWRTTLTKKEPYNFTEGPPVRVRGKDIILCQGKGEGGLPNLAARELREFKDLAFGYSENELESPWEQDFSQRKVSVTLQGWNKPVEVTTTSELVTEMRSRSIYPLNPTSHAAEEEKITYLSHDDFFYFIRLQNLSDEYQEVTVRIFLAPEIWVNNESSTNRDNTVWIEMDRFMQELDGGERTVVFRPAKVSAVIRKPAIGHAELENPKRSRDFDDPWCDCGWPYSLLLPRGTEKGLGFRLLVMLSSGDDLSMTDTGQENTSMGYCGLKNMKYPDKQLMGYPFDRPLTESVDSICDKNDNWASRTITIRCKNPELDLYYPQASRQATSDTTSTSEPKTKGKHSRARVRGRSEAAGG